MPRMWLMSGRSSGRKTLLQYSSLTPLERECYEGEVQPYRKMDYKPMMMMMIRTKRIQPARGWCATVPQSGGLFGGTLCKLYPPTPPLRRPGLPVFWGSQPCVPAAWLAERLLLAGDIESNPGPRPTLKTPTHTHTQPPTLTKFTDSLIQPPRPCPPPLSIVHPKHPLTPLHQPPHSLPTP